MSGVGSYTTAQAVRSAAAAHGYSQADDHVSQAFDRLLFTIASGTIDAALLVAHGRKTIQPEDFAALAKLHSIFSAPLGPKSRARPKSRSVGMSGGGDISNTGSYYNPSNNLDMTAYSSANGEGHGGSTTDLPQDYARSALDYYAQSPVSLPLMGGAGKTRQSSKEKASKSSSTKWSLPSESITRVLKEYRLRFNNDVRMTGAAKLYLRAAIKSNIDAVLNATRNASKSVRLTSSALKRASDGHVLVLT